MKEKDIISRRKFFKKSASAIIPAIAIAVVPQILTSCEIDEPLPGTGGSSGSGSSSCSECSSSCLSGCYKGCKTTCSTLCGGTCVTGCKGVNRNNR